MSELLRLYSKAPKPLELIKAMKDDASKDIIVPKSAIIDPANVMNYVGTRHKPWIVPMHVLRRIANVPAISAIIKTRLNQMARFTGRPRFEGDEGFKVTTKSMESKMSPAEKKEAQRIEDMLLLTGAVRNRKRRDNWDTFIRKIGRDSLILDAMTFELVPNLKGDLAEFWAIDAATIEMVAQEPVSDEYTLPVYEPVTKRGLAIAGEIAYVQKVMGQVVAEYTEDELCYAVRNPYTELEYTPFGRSELEDLVEIVTGIVNGVRYNTSYFNHSSLPQGVLEIIGKYKDEHLEAFKRHWKIMTSGAEGKWKVPVMALEEGNGFKWTPFKNSNRDMEFNQFLEFLFNVACAVYQIDPNEVGFKSWTSKQSGLSQSDNTEEKIAQSQDKGFLPLMRFMSNTISTEIIDQVNQEFCFTWTGLDDEAEQRQWSRAKEEIEAGTLTANEYREIKDRPKTSWGDAPANNVLIQVYTADKQAEMQQQQLQTQGDQQMAMVDKQHANAKELQGMQHQQGLEMNDLQHGQQKELQQMQHGNAKELQGMQQVHDIAKQDKDQEFQKQEGSVGRWHEEQMADKQHANAKELAGMQGDQKAALQKDEHSHQDAMADKQAKLTEGASKADHERQKELADQGQKHKVELAEKTAAQQRVLQSDKSQADFKKQALDHSHASEMEDKKAKYAEATQGREHKHDESTQGREHQHAEKMADKQHEQKKELGEQQYKGQRNLQAQKDQAALVHKKADQDFQREQGTVTHKRGIETSRMTHKQQLELLKEKNKGQRPKTRLQKSLEDIYLADNQMIERCAEKVHEAWMRSAGTSDNPDMKAYEDLHEAVKETDRATARAVIEQLLKEGIIPSEELLTKAIETGTFEETEEGRVLEVNLWDVY